MSHAMPRLTLRRIFAEASLANSKIWVNLRLKKNDEKLKEADKAPLNKAIEKARETAKGDDPQKIKSAIEELEQASGNVGVEDLRCHCDMDRTCGVVHSQFV